MKTNEELAKYKVIEEFSLLTLPNSTINLNKIAEKQLLKLGILLKKLE